MISEGLNRNRHGDDARPLEGPKITPVEAGGMSCKNEDIVGAETTAALPDPHDTTSVIDASGNSGRTTVDDDRRPDPANLVARQSRDRLQQEGPAAEVATLDSTAMNIGR